MSVNNNTHNMDNTPAIPSATPPVTTSAVTSPVTATLTISVNFAAIPLELKQNASFCVWKREKRNGKLTKVPCNPTTGNYAKTDAPSTFAPFSVAMTTYAMGGWDGIGIRVSEGIGAIDIDHCIREDGSLNDVAASILAFFPDAYFERSPSGTGLRGFFKLGSDFAYDKTVYYINNRKNGLEVYLPGVTNRFVTVTGNVYRSGIVSRNDEGLQKALDTFMRRKSAAKPGFKGTPVSYFTDDEVIAHASASKSGDKFKALLSGDWTETYESQSDADMAFVSILCFWCGCVEEQIDRIFRSSGLMRDKWDRMTGGATYGQITIRNAITTCSEIYRPVRAANYDTAAHDFNAIGQADAENSALADATNATDAADIESTEVDFSKFKIDEIQEERDRRERMGYSFTPDLRFLDTTVEQLAPHTNPRYESFQIGNCKMFVDYYRRIILKNDTRGCWYIYDGRVWRPDTHNVRIGEMAKDFHDVLLQFASTITSADTRDRFLKRVEALDQRKFRDIMVKDAGDETDITVQMEAFDRDKYIFNCHNGTINLITGEFRPHSPEDLLTKMTEVDYDPNASCLRWTTFLDEVFEGDTDRIRYLQKAVGYAMSGDTRLECMFILYGPTSRNGKGTTMETILRILGEYGRTAKPDMLSKKNFADSSGPSEDVARLNGARMVNVSEPEKSMVIDASLTKQMTGNNTLTARYLRENSFEFKPQFKLFIDTNHLPQISDMTLFESDRIRIIPFNRHFTAEERDIDLKSYFAKPENLSGILNWCLEGFRLYQEEGLKMPGSVESATQEYRDQSDRLTMFTVQCLKHGKEEIGKDLRAAAIYTRYKEWCGENGFKYENAANFRKKMENMGFVYQRRRPWGEKGAPLTTMVNDVNWAADEDGNSEAPEEDFVPMD